MQPTIEYQPVRIGNVDNPFQKFEVHPRTLCVCTGGLLRSPTLAWLLGNAPYNRNARAAGSEAAHALVLVDEVLLKWADEIVFLNRKNAESVGARFNLAGKRYYVLDVPDRFAYRDPALVALLPKELARAGFPESATSCGCYRLELERAGFPTKA